MSVEESFELVEVELEEEKDTTEAAPSDTFTEVEPEYEELDGTEEIPVAEAYEDVDGGVQEADDSDILFTDDSAELEYEELEETELDDEGNIVESPDAPPDNPDDDVEEEDVTEEVEDSEGIGEEEPVDEYDILFTDDSAELEYEELEEADEDAGEYDDIPVKVLNDNIATLPCTCSVKKGDTVQITIIEGEPIVTGVVGWGDRIEADILTANELADDAMTAADEARTKAGIALLTADQANQNAQNAFTAAAEVAEKADDAMTAADEAKSAVADITNDLNSVKTDASQTLGDAINGLTEKKIEVMTADYATNDDLKQQEVDLKSEIERSAGKIQTTLQAEYARKTDLTEAKVELQSQITQTSDKISTSVSSIADAMANLQNEEVRAAIEAAKTNLSTASTNLSDAKVALVTAQTESANAVANAALAQNQASDANASLVNAQNKLVDAQAYRDKLISLGASTEAIEEAEQAVVAAQNAVTAAQSAADTATANAQAAQQEVATAAQAVVNAEANVATAQEAYDLAVDGLHEASYSGIEQTADAITSRVTKTEMQEAVDDIEVGGRNYIRNGRGNVKEGFFKYFDSVNEDYGEHAFTSQKTYERIDIGSGFVLGGRDYEVGKEVVFSYEIMYTTWDFPVGTDRKEFWIGQRYESQKISGGDTTGQWRSITSHALPIVGQNGCELNEWYRVEYKTTIPEQAAEGIVVGSNIQFHNSNADVAASIAFRMKNVKLEYGNKATDWSPAPEDHTAYTDAAAEAVQNSVNDMDVRVTTSETVIQQLADSISSIVRSGEETSLVKQDESGLFYFDIEALQSSADASASSIADLMKAIGDIDPDSEETLLGKLSGMETTLTALGIKTEYVNVSTYEDEPCIILGETDSTFKLLITNTRIVFLEGSTETTYIKDNTLVTNNVEVKEDIRQGRWAWKSRPNGNLGLVWIGGDE